ncbi:PhoU domain-containing protein [Sulfurovum sp. AR]|uniref:PhoU domain-containing protein n=1 Tax=Sulfurovum sp. AR TaxID=1165841 RepID=UPI00025C4F4A|nr:PhoU domain-containing protein [Sulfurovum sp. AR]EIF50690.1 phosphate transport system regulator [Sulfurovum sp. AR]
MLPGYQEARLAVRADVLNVLEGLATANKEGLEALQAIDAVKLEEARSRLKDISQETEKIDNDIVLIFAKYTPEARDLRELVSYLKITSALNRIRTNINSYLKNMQSMLMEKNDKMTQLIQDSLSINRCTLNAFDYTIEMLQTFDDNDQVKALAARIDVEYSKTDDIYTLLEKDVIQQIGNADGLAEEYFNLLKHIRKNLKIIDRLESVSQRVIFARMGGKL